MTFRRVGVLADDLTGAGDVALAFEAVGLRTEIWTPAGRGLPTVPGPGVRVWILDMESRSLSPKRAARAVRRGVRALCHWKPDFFFKKIDSTLRGPVGAELAAFIESVFPEGPSTRRGADHPRRAAERVSGPVPFVPAFPRMGRTTVQGRHFVNGVPLHRSPFGQDPIHPIRTNVLSRILAASWPSGSQQQNAKSRERVRERVVWAPDVVKEREMVSVARKALLGRAAVGSAGFAAAIAREMGTGKPKNLSAIRAQELAGGAIGVVAGSAHPLTGRQMERLKNILPLRNVFIIERPLHRGAPGRVLRRLVLEARRVEETHRVRRWVVTGGETAFAMARFWNQSRWRVAGFVEPGVALCRSVGRPRRWWVLKPGGFGSLNVMAKAVCLFQKKAGPRDTR